MKPSSRYGSAAMVAAKKGGRIGKFGGGALGYAQGGNPNRGGMGGNRGGNPNRGGMGNSPQTGGGIPIPQQATGKGPQTGGGMPIPQGVMDQYNAVNQQAAPQQQYLAGMQMGAGGMQPPARNYAAENTIIPEAQQYANYANQQMAASRPADPYYVQPDASYTGESGSYNRGGRAGYKKGGGVFTGSGYPGKIPGVVPGGRIARKSGGKAKGAGKTNINIVIAGKPQSDMEAPMPPMPPPGGPAAPPPMGGAPGMPPGMPPAPPMGGPGPMGRKAGGRAYKSYKDMDAGAGSGLGRLEKSEIAKRTAHKAGGKVYRSYKDMDAGSGSGLGRLEKTEIASRRRGS